MERLKKLYLKVSDNKKIFKITAVVILIIIAVLFFGLKDKSKTISVQEAEAKSNSNTTSEESKELVYVDVGGEVKSPGVYKVEKNSRIFEVISKAGGLTNKADTTNLNQAEVIKDGQKIEIPAKNQGNTPGTDSTAPAQSTETSSKTAAVININSADSSQLQEIPGVGPATADKILNYRKENGSFKKKEDLKNVSGIGEKKYAKMKDKIIV